MHKRLRHPEPRDSSKAVNCSSGLPCRWSMIIENAPPRGIGYRQLRELDPQADLLLGGPARPVGPGSRTRHAGPVGPSACGFVHGHCKEFGGPRPRSALWMADHVGGSSAAIGILAALLYRENVSGEGQNYIRNGASAEAIIRILDYSWACLVLDGWQHPPALRQLGDWPSTSTPHKCLQGRLHDGGRRPRSPLVPHLAHGGRCQPRC